MVCVMMKHVVLCAALLSLGACGLIDSHNLSTDYSFDAQHFTSPKWDESQTASTLPSVPCDSSADSSCASAALFPADSGLQSTCDPISMACVAVAEIRLSELVELSKQTSFPKEAIQFGIEAVAIRRVSYWVASNTFNFPTPKIEIYVAPQAAKDERDDKARLLGVIGPLSAKSSSCSDPVDTRDEALTGGARECDMTLDSAGEAALGDFAKNFGTPFQVMAHAVVIAKGGDPVPSGNIDFYIRPTIGLSILK
jgi:hypothetical protein